jgi:hemolysin activation/secretion protein
VLGGIGKVGLDLDYYDRKGRPAAYRLEGQGLLAQGLARAGDSDFSIGARYAYVDTTSTFERERVVDIPKRDLDVRIGRLSLIVDYDSRDNFFTPSRGTYAEAEFAVANEGLGGNVDFRSFLVRAFHYIPAGDFVIGLRGDYRISSEDTPFFAKPFVQLRGIPALRYQDDQAAVVETEVRWNVTRRWAVLGFVGAGKACGRRADWSEADTAVAKGVGLRYLVARKLGLYTGVDFAWGPEDRGFHIQVGGAWY